jgi:putative restriction endonuclease
MRLFVAVTDNDWFALHASRDHVEEVNFWRPSPEAGFKALQPGELLLFKLHAPMNFIAGGGFFVRFHQLPVNLRWETYGEANGVQSLEEMRQRIAYYRRTPILRHENPNIGCIMLAEPAIKVSKSKKKGKNLYSPNNAAFGEKNLIDWLDQIVYPY